jgi:hypothetical protein
MTNRIIAGMASVDPMVADRGAANRRQENRRRGLQVSADVRAERSRMLAEDAARREEQALRDAEVRNMPVNELSGLLFNGLSPEALDRVFTLLPKVNIANVREKVDHLRRVQESMGEKAVDSDPSLSIKGSEIAQNTTKPRK